MDKSQLDPNQSRQTFPLGKNQRYFLLTGKKGSARSKTKVEEDIESKLDELVPRIQDLIDDIILLHYGGLIHSDWENGWNQLTDISSSTKLRDTNVQLSDQFKDPFKEYRKRFYENSNFGGEKYNHVKLGFAFGQAIRALYDAFPQREPEHLLWGLAVGVIGEPYEKRDEEFQRFTDLFEDFQKFMENRYKNPPQDSTYTRMIVDYNHRIEASVFDSVLPASIRTSISREDLPITLPLIIEAFPGPDEVYRDAETTTEIIELCEGVREILLEDFDALELKSRKRLEAKDVFRELWATDGYRSSKSIASSLSGTSATQVGKILNDLSGRGMGDSPWNERPIVNREDAKYNTTNYGDLVGFCLFQIYNIRSWMHSCLCGREDSYNSVYSPFESCEEYFNIQSAPDSELELLEFGFSQLD